MATRTGTIGRDILDMIGEEDLLRGDRGRMAMRRGDNEPADVKTGTNNADTLDGSGGADTLSGLGGNDLLNCFGGNDYALGGIGNDRIFGDSGDDDLYGEAGGDNLFGDIGIDYLDGGVGNDSLRGGGDNEGSVNIVQDPEFGIVSWGFLINSIYGGLIGYDGADTIYGDAGNDVALGGYEYDIIDGGIGNDVLIGGAFADGLLGGDGHDVIIGDTLANFNFADPRLVGGPGGDDSILGEAGDDILYGGVGSDTLSGGVGIDYLYGSISNASNTTAGYTDGADELDGGEGNDVLRGGEGDDLLVGGEDDDNLRGDLGDDTMDGGDGHDLVSYRYDDIGLTQGVTVGLPGVGPESGTVMLDDLRGGLDTVIDVEAFQLVGSQYDDEMEGSQGDDAVLGNDGEDTLSGHYGNDTLDGGAGVDAANYVYDPFGQSQVKLIFDASAYSGEGPGVVLFDIAGVDTGTDQVVAIERFIVTGAGRGDQLIGSGVDDDMNGRFGNDTLEGGAGDDSLTGDFGRDSLSGGNGADTLDGRDRDGNGEVDPDVLYGGADDDVYYIDGDQVFENAGEGQDTVRTFQSQYTLDDNVEDLVLLTFSGDPNVFNVHQGNALDNRITGNALANQLKGGDGDDTVFGGDGDDFLSGGKGEDQLHGELGDDTYELANEDATITELDGEGLDTVVVGKFDYTLDLFLENLELTGSRSLNGTGNDLDNRITGNDGRNDLAGEKGDDTLEGGGGSDKLRPGGGEDVIRIDDVGDSTGLTFDRVYSARFDVQDRIDVGILPTEVAILDGGILRDSRFDLDLELAVDETVLAADGAVLFNPAAGDYENGNVKFLIVDANGFAGYQASADYVIALYNMSGTLGVNDFIIEPTDAPVSSGLDRAFGEDGDAMPVAIGGGRGDSMDALMVIA